MSEYDTTRLGTSLPAADRFSAVMRRFASSLTIVTTQHLERRVGMIPTAHCSVSAGPPSIVVGVNRNSTAWPAITEDTVNCAFTWWQYASAAAA